MNRCYEIIKKHYEGRVASRSGLPYMNHINEGLKILNYLGVIQEVKDAFCLHPIFQMDDSFYELTREFINKIDPYVLFLTMEYRAVANSYRPIDHFADRKLRISVIPGVNLMLVADKVQNRKDYEIYQDINYELASYFKLWLSALSVSEDEYEKMRGLL